jgi:F-type H+-transporting ATPase subunit delta
MAGSGGARRYAEAVFELAVRDGRVEECRSEIGFACGLAQDGRLVRMVDNPTVSLQRRRELLEQILAGRVSRQVLNLAQLLAARSRFSLMPAISDEYDALVRRSRDIVGVSVTTPVPLSREELEAIRLKMEKLVGARVEIDAQTNPALIGGLCVTIGDHQIDASVSSRLARLRRQLLHGTSKAGAA